MNERIKTAVELLKIGHSLRVGDLRLGVENSEGIYVTGWSRFSNLKYLTKSIAVKELHEVVDLFQSMVASSVELKEFVKNKTVKYNLAFDYGQGSIGICSLKDKTLTWEIDLK